MRRLAGAALAALMAGAANTVKIYGYERIRMAMRQHKPDHTARGRGSIATGNRWGGAHEHKREIARRQRQALPRTATITVRLGGYDDPYAEIPV